MRDHDLILFMQEHDFIAENSTDWDVFEDDLASLGRNAAGIDAGAIARRYKKVCHDLSLARHRMYSANLLDRLNRLVIEGSQYFRKPVQPFWLGVGRFLLYGFPVAFRREWRLFCLSTLSFMIPCAWAMYAVQKDTTWAYALLGSEGMAQAEMMYGSESGLAEWRGEFDSDFAMFGFYIRNNVQIGFQMFAGGLLAGVGTLFFLIFNGVFIGAFFGYVHVAADPERLYTFVIGHGSLEITGLLIAGMAGLRLGIGILMPGRLRRGESLKRAAKRGLPLIYGGGLMIFLAAFIEGFWSAQDQPVDTKYLVGGILWTLTFAYLLLAGRGKEHYVDEA